MSQTTLISSAIDCPREPSRPKLIVKCRLHQHSEPFTCQICGESITGNRSSTRSGYHREPLMPIIVRCVRPLGGPIVHRHYSKRTRFFAQPVLATRTIVNCSQ